AGAGDRARARDRAARDGARRGSHRAARRRHRRRARLVGDEGVRFARRLAAVLLVALAACERGHSAAPSHSSGTGAGAGTQAPAMTWDDASAGPVLFVAGSNETEAAIIFPHFTDSTLGTVSALDTGIVGRSKTDLFARAGLIGTASIVPKSVGALGGDCT